LVVLGGLAFPTSNASAATPPSGLTFNQPPGAGYMAHARALLTSHPTGAVAYVEADLHDPKRILTDPAVPGALDFGRPVALLLVVHGRSMAVPR
jgi:hypothetical protein